MSLTKGTCCVVALAACLCTGGVPADDSERQTSQVLTGDSFVERLTLTLQLDWNACPDSFEAVREQSDTDVRCAVIGAGDPFREAERLALMQASVGGRVLDVESHDGLPDHLFAANRSLRPIAPVLGYDRLVYLIDDQRVSMWIQRTPTPLVEGGEPERWIAIRVNDLDEPFPDYMPAR